MSGSAPLVTTVSNRTPAQTQAEKEDRLGQSKDRAQMTAATAMSIVHVALLKEVLVLGPQYSRYYGWTVGLICMSLALQVLAGAIHLHVNNLRVNYAKNNQDAVQDFCINIGCCSQHMSEEGDRVASQSASTATAERSQGAAESKGCDNPGFTIADDTQADPAIASCENIDVRITPSEDIEERVASCENIDELFHMKKLNLQLNQDDSGDGSNCCPCQFGGSDFYNYEYAILDAYDNWRVEYLDIELEAVAADLQRSQLKDDIVTLEQALRSYPEGSTSFTAEEGTSLNEARNKMAAAECHLVKKKVGGARGVVLEERARAITRKQVLKRAAFWQQVMNFIFYVVFTVNAFIAGLGTAGGATNMNNLSGGDQNSSTYSLSP